MKIALTGATGHIGNVLCRLLLERGHEVAALIRTESAAIQGIGVSTVIGDLDDHDRLDELMQGADAVVHLAAIISIGHISNEQVYSVNVGGTQNMLAAARRNGISHFYHLSSIDAHISPGLHGVLDESTPYVDASKRGYGHSKATAEQAVIAARDKGMKTTVFNPTGVVGPYDFKPGFLGKLVVDLCHKRIPVFTPLGYDWVDVRDVADAICVAIERRVANEKFLLPGAWRSLTDLGDIVQANTGVAPPSYTVPFWLAKTGVPFIRLYGRLSGSPPLYTAESLRTLQGTCKNVRCDRATRSLDYNPRPLEDVIPDTIDWFRQNGYINI